MGNLTDEKFNRLMNSFNDKLNKISFPKIKRVNPFLGVPNFLDSDTMPYDNTPMNDEEYKEYLEARKHPKVPKLYGVNRFVDYTKSVDWNLRGNIRYNDEKKRREDEYLQSLRDAGYNNEEKIKNFKTQVLCLFKTLLSEAYSTTIFNNERLLRMIPVKLTNNFYVSLNDFLEYTTTTSSASAYFIEYNSVFLSRAARTLLYKIRNDKSNYEKIANNELMNFYNKK